MAGLIAIASAFLVAAWVVIPSGTTECLGAVRFADANQGWAIGDGGTILRTVDGGRRWTPVPNGFSNDSLLGLDAIDDQRLWISTGHGRILQSTDGGQTWVLAHQARTGLWAIDFADPDHGWTVGLMGLVLHTADGGQTWISQTVPYDFADIYDVQFVDDRLGWTAGEFGVVYRTTDGGETWEDVSPPSFLSLRALSFVDRWNGWVVGRAGQIYQTTDAGTTWITQTVIHQDLLDVRFVDASTGWAVGLSGTILQTTDGGGTWTLAPSGTNAWLFGTDSFRPHLGWAVGCQGTILRLAGADTRARVFFPAVAHSLPTAGPEERDRSMPRLPDPAPPVRGGDPGRAAERRAAFGDRSPARPWIESVGGQR